MAQEQDVLEVNLATEAGVVTEETKREMDDGIEGLITFDQLTMNFIQQYEEVKEEYIKLQEALDKIETLETRLSDAGIA